MIEFSFLTAPAPYRHRRRMPDSARLLRSCLSLLLVLGLGCRGNATGPQFGPPAAISFVGGSTTIGTVGSLTTPIPTARVTDASGLGVAGVGVRFVVVTGNGVVTGDSVVTDAQGRATVGAWRLGPLPGPQVLRAQISGKAFAADLTAAVSPGPAASLQVLSGGSGLSALLNQAVPMPPVVRVVDSFGNPLANSEVSWRILSGGGAIIGPTVTHTNAAGHTTITGWRLGPTPGSNALEARASGGITAVIQATAIDLPHVVEAASPREQQGTSNFQVARTPRVRVLGSGGEPLAGVPVQFTLLPGGSTDAIAGTSAVTDSLGIASLGDWRIGGSGTSTVYANVPGLPASNQVSFTATGSPLPFTIDLRFLSLPSADIRDSFVEAAHRWMEIVVGDVPDLLLSISPGSCVLDNSPGVNEQVDDLIVFADFATIDGPGGIVGQANFCQFRWASRIPVAGGMQFDIADAQALQKTGRFKATVLHELGHVLGLSKFNWDPLGLVTGLGGGDPVFIGQAGTAGWQTLGIVYGGQPVPVENEHGEGTRDSHWRESVLGSELMTGILEPEGVAMPLTRLTIGALQDAGYQVDVSRADPYVPTLRSALLRSGPKERLGETLVPPGHVVDRHGVVRPIQ